jgi:TRAP-type C4-dicarboxylate transport system permease small subunit
MKKLKLKFDELIAASLLSIMSVLTFVNVINRYVFKKSIAFTEEITINLFVWITLLGIAVAFRRGANLKMTSILDLLSPRIQKLAVTISGVIGTIIFLFVIFNSVQEIYKNITFYHATSAALGIPTWIYSMGTPLFSVFIIVEIWRSTFYRVRQVDNNEEEAQ